MPFTLNIPTWMGQADSLVSAGNQISNALSRGEITQEEASALLQQAQAEALRSEQVGRFAPGALSALVAANPGQRSFSPQQGTPQTSKSLTESEVYNKYNRGGYGTVGSTEAINAALEDLAQYFKDTGMTTEQAVARATRSFDAVVGSGGAQDAIIGGGGAGTGPVPGTGPITGIGGGVGTGAGAGAGGGAGVDPNELFAGYTAPSITEQQRKKWLELERTSEGRGDIWGEAIRSQYPGASNPFQAFLGRQQDEAFNQYMLQSAFGPSHAGDTPLTTFRDYARGGGGGGGQRLSQSQMADMLGQWGSALSNQDTSGLSKAMLNWLPYMRQGANQFGTALQSSIGNVPGAARPFYESAAGRAFSDYEVNNPESGGWLNQWLGKNRRFF
mgnify:FL=1